jgi:hypothetical protein
MAWRWRQPARETTQRNNIFWATRIWRTHLPAYQHFALFALAPACVPLPRAGDIDGACVLARGDIAARRTLASARYSAFRASASLLCMRAASRRRQKIEL